MHICITQRLWVDTESMMGKIMEYNYSKIEGSLLWSWLVLTNWPLGDLKSNFKTAIFNLVLLIGIFTSSKDNALRWMPRDLTNGKSTLVQVMAWCRQAPSHYLSQCWTISPYGVTRPQWVKPINSGKNNKGLPQGATCIVKWNHCSWMTSLWSSDIDFVNVLMLTQYLPCFS